MVTIRQAIAEVRNSVGAIMRVQKVEDGETTGQDQSSTRFRVSFVGSAWCITDRELFVTANHVFNGNEPRNQNDRFFLFLTVDNGPVAYHFPITGFAIEDNKLDLAVVRVAMAPDAPVTPHALPLSSAPVEDGAQVLTLGFPAPEISQGKVDQHGNWGGGSLFLKSHANEGIVAAQYDIGGGVLAYELNVGWHHGESGGPICAVTDSLAVFSLMQYYRNIPTPHGVVAGPHVGRSLSAVEARLSVLGARFV